MIKHWITTLFGLGCLIFGAWTFHVHWVSYQSLYFNLVYVEPPQLAMIAAGLVGLFAADARQVKTGENKTPP